MPDRLFLHGITAQCRLGVHEWEQAAAQTVWIDVEVEIDASRAARRDDVRDAVDYATLVERLKRAAEARPYRLMETLAQELAAAALKEAGTPRAKIRVTKRALPGIDAATVEVERTQAARLTARRPRRVARSPAP